MGNFYIDGEAIEYEEKKSARAKRLIISIRAGRIRVTVPLQVSSRQVALFVESKKHWVYSHWKKQQTVRKALAEQDLFVGADFLYLGHPIHVQATLVQAQRTKVLCQQGGLELFIPKSLVQNMEFAERQARVKDVLNAWYKEDARKFFKEKLDYYGVKMKVEYHDFRVKEQKTKWGSCSGKGNINLNWRLMMAPEQVINYVVIHELAHLRHPNHGPRFWQFVAMVMPDYMEWRGWLRKNGTSLWL